MSTRAQLRQRVFDNLYSADPKSRPARLRLNGALNDSSESVVVDDDTGIVGREIIEFADGEQAYVLSTTSNTLSAVRAQNGTTAAAHGDNEFVLINPIYSIKQVNDALDEALRDMDDTHGLYQLAAATDITLVAGQDVYELTETDVRVPPGVLSVFYQETSNSELVGLPFRNVSDPFGGVLTGELAVRLVWWGNNSAGDALEVVYAQSLIGLIDDGLTEGVLEDAAIAYATARVLMAQEGGRSHDPGRWTDRTVQPGQHLRNSAFWLGQYQRLVWRYRAQMKRKELDLPGSRFRRARHFRR